MCLRVQHKPEIFRVVFLFMLAFRSRDGHLVYFDTGRRRCQAISIDDARLNRRMMLLRDTLDASSSSPHST